MNAICTNYTVQSTKGNRVELYGYSRRERRLQSDLLSYPADLTPKGYIQASPKGHKQASPKGHIQASPNGHMQASPKGHVQPSPKGHIQASPKGHIEASSESFQDVNPKMQNSTVRR